VTRYTPEDEARINAAVKFLIHHPKLPTCGAAWKEAWDAGVAFAKHADCSVCGGLRRIEYEDHGWCRCPACAPIVHSASGDEVLCGITIHTEELRQSTAAWEEVTCADCLQNMLTEARDALADFLHQAEATEE
jgi:hypothetical protein